MKLLPRGWQRNAFVLGAFQRSRRIKTPETLLRILLYHAVSGAGLRLTVERLAQAGIANLSSQALHQRLRTAGPWLGWIAARLCQSMFEQVKALPVGLRLRVVDATAIQRPGSLQLDWRLHYSITLLSMTCDWFRVTDVHRGESLSRLPVRAGDVLLADRYYFTIRGVNHVRTHKGQLIVRLRWNHAALEDAQGHPFQALAHARRLKVGEVAQWQVRVPVPGRKPVKGRVVAMRLPARNAREFRRKIKHDAERKHRRLDPRSWEAAQLVMLFTTVPDSLLTADEVLSLYRGRWQVERTFHLLKQLLKLGHVPHRVRQAALAWIQAKLVVALLVEKARLDTRSWSFRGLRRLRLA